MASNGNHRDGLFLLPENHINLLHAIIEKEQKSMVTTPLSYVLCLYASNTRLRATRLRRTTHLAPYCLFSTRLVLGVRTTRHVADSAMIFQLHCIKDLQELTEHTHTPSDNSLTTPPRRGIKRVVAKHSEDPDSHT